jgi:F0F1-type ATP synthase gamma subunit
MRSTAASKYMTQHMSERKRQKRTLTLTLIGKKDAESVETCYESVVMRYAELEED